jgi:hypothetical protein
MTQVKKQVLQGDIVIHSVGPKGYVIATMSGEEVARSHDRFDAMQRACTAARLTGANVWICHDESSKTYSEVLCP